MSNIIVPKKFCHLHVHTTFSLLDGISRREDLAKKAKAFGMDALAITDHGNIYNAVSFYKTCKEVGIKPIIGSEFYVAPDSRFGRKYSSKAAAQEEAEDGDLSYSAYHLGVLARNRQGYENLKALSTKAFREGFYRKPRIDLELLTEHKEGLIILSGCLASMTSRFIVAGQVDKAIELIDKQRGIFGENFFLEIMHHDIGHEENIVNEALIDIGNKHGIPLLMTNDSHYTDREDATAQEVALCIGTNKEMNNPAHFKFNGEGYWFKDADEMKHTAEVAGFPQSSLDNTAMVANMVEDYGFKLTSAKSPPLIPLFRNKDGEPLSAETCDSLLEMKVWNGLVERGMGDKQEYQERVVSELKLIKEKDFSSYFLIISDIIDFMRSKGILAPIGRGSSVGSLVCYCLFITGLDPVRWKIPFSRFINDGRKDLPDIDTDISQARRKEVIDYIVKRYGEDRVAQIVTFQSMGAKAAVDNVGRALGVPSATRRQVGHLIGDVTKDDHLEEIVAGNKKVRELMEQVPDWVHIASKLEGNNKNLGAHAAGIVISNDPLADYVPLVRDSKEGYLTTQFDMKDLQELGLLKLDMLGLKTIDLIQYTLEMVERRYQLRMDFHNFPLDDAATYQTIAEGRYVSTFQYDSSGIRMAARQLKPETFEHLAALNALYRPGPMKKVDDKPSIMEQYFERRHGRAPIETWHPELDGVYGDTYGLPLFQEQVMKMTQIIAGFNETEADEYRSAIGKKDAIKFKAAQDKFKERGVAKGRDPVFMDSIIQKLEGFARYGWNIGHSMAYSYISFVTAYLETHYPLEYYTVLLNVNSDDADQLKVLLSAILQKGVKILPPHINESRSDFYTDGTNIYMGIYSVRQVGEAALKSIIEDRDKNGKYVSFIEFCIRMAHHSRCTKLVKDNLIKAGAFNWDMEFTNKDKYENVELIQKIIKKFDGKIPPDMIEEQIRTKIVVSGVDWPENDRLSFERAVLNFYISSHPVTQYAPLFNLFPRLNLITPSQLGEQQFGSRVILMGVVENREMKSTQKGDPYLRLRVGDQMGSIEVMIWSPLATSVYGKVSDQTLVLINGTVKEDKFRAGEPQLSVNSVSPISNSGLPISSYYADSAITANRVQVALNADVGSVSDQIMQMGHVVILRSTAYMRPEHYAELKQYKVDYQLSI